jgi:peptide/nickel transport system ATP-binding protein
VRQPESLPLTQQDSRPDYAAAPAPYLSVTDLGVKFPTEDGIVTAVEGVSFSVARGKTLAVVGESGSGKSVTSLAIMGLVDRKRAKVTGEVWLDGEELLEMSDNDVRKLRGSKMAMIFQDPMSSLHPFYRVGSQLTEAIRVHRKLSKAQARNACFTTTVRSGSPFARAVRT